nr:MAG TPA: hypothetical protein [Caudoviricetes sp.]
MVIYVTHSFFKKIRNDARARVSYLMNVII